MRRAGLTAGPARRPNRRSRRKGYASRARLGPGGGSGLHPAQLRDLGPVYLDQVALDFPNLTIVGGHIGYPWTDEAIAVATKHENVFIDTSAYTTRRYPCQLVDYMKSHGKSKVLFGTNFPMISPAKALAGLEELGLPDEVASLFLAGNSRRVFGL